MSTTRDYVQPGVVDSSTRPYAGFTLVSHVGSADVHLIDMNGAVVHKWRTPAELGTHAVLLPNGNLLCATRIDKGPLSDLEGAAGSILELDWNGKVVWQHEDPYMHHDFCRMPNGNTIFLRWVPTPNDMAVKVKGGLPGTEREGIMWSDSLREIDPTGQVVWEWVGYEHLNPEVDIICPICFRNEWTHANSFKVTSEGQVLISFMKTNTIALLNREEGYVYWRWGGFRVLGHPHDAEMKQ